MIRSNYRFLSAMTLLAFGGRLLLMPLSAYAADGDLDSSFNSGGSGISNYAAALALQSDGKILVGGNFDAYNDNSTPHQLIRLNSDGSIDASFNSGGSGFNGGEVDTISIQSNGKILVGGIFSTYNGSSVANGLVRLNADGTLDSTFNSGGSGFDGAWCPAAVYKIVVLSNGKILVGGCFDTYNGSSVPNGLLRLNADGSFDSSFNSGGSGIVGQYVYQIAVLSSGKILVGSASSTYNGSAASGNLFRLSSDGSYDATFNTGGSGFNNIAAAIAETQNNKIIVGGYFSQFNGSNVPTLVRLNSNGSLDDTFNNGGSGPDSFVYAIAMLPDSTMLVTGNFGTYNGESYYFLLRLQANGNRDTSFNVGDYSIYGAGTQGREFLVLEDGKVIVSTGNWSIWNGNDVPKGIVRFVGFTPPHTLTPPSSRSAVLVSDSNVDVSSTAQSGTKAVRLLHSTKPAVDVSINFSSSVDLSDITVTRDDSQFATVVHGLYGHAGVTGNITMYTKKSDIHSLFRYCSGKETLGCTSSDNWSALWDVSGSLVATNGGFDASPFTLSVTTVDGEQVWKLVGPIASGGEGESSGAVPEFGYIPFALLLMSCCWFLKKRVMA